MWVCQSCVIGQIFTAWKGISIHATSQGQPQWCYLRPCGLYCSCPPWVGMKRQTESRFYFRARSNPPPPWCQAHAAPRWRMTVVYFCCSSVSWSEKKKESSRKCLMSSLPLYLATNLAWRWAKPHKQKERIKPGHCNPTVIFITCATTTCWSHADRLLTPARVVIVSQEADRGKQTKHCVTHVCLLFLYLSVCELYVFSLCVCVCV